jgi:uncharacterized protein with HEPN domain
VRSDEERLRDIVEHADLIGAHLPASREAPDSDVVLAAALVRWVGIVGEAAGRLSESFRRSRPEVPWAEIAGMRNHLVHGYFAVDADLLWVAPSRWRSPVWPGRSVRGWRTDAVPGAGGSGWFQPPDVTRFARCRRWRAGARMRVS